MSHNSDVTCVALELRDRLVTMSLKFEKLVVMTTNQCLLFSNNNWSSPATVDMRSGVIAHLVVQAEDTVLVVDQAGAISVFLFPICVCVCADAGRVCRCTTMMAGC